MTERNIIRQNIMKGGAENGGNKRNLEQIAKLIENKAKTPQEAAQIVRDAKTK